MEPQDRLFTIAEAAEYLRVPVKTLYNWRYLGTAPQAIKLGKRVFYRESALLAFLEANTEEVN